MMRSLYSLQMRSLCVIVVIFMLALPAHALRPINTATRTARGISSNAWVLKLDPADVGIAQNWAMRKLSGQLFDAPVPATLNDIIGADPRATPAASNWTDGYFSAAFYETEIFIPAGWKDVRHVALRFDSVTFNAAVFLNGHAVGSHSGRQMAFETGDLSSAAVFGAANRLTVRVDGFRTWASMPPGGWTRNAWGVPVLLGGDAGYGYSTIGIDGAVHLVSTPSRARIVDVDVVTFFNIGYKFSNILAIFCCSVTFFKVT